MALDTSLGIHISGREHNVKTDSGWEASLQPESILVSVSRDFAQSVQTVNDSNEMLTVIAVK